MQDKHKSLPEGKQQEKQVGNGNGTVTWRWIAIVLTASLTTVGGYLYKRMDDKVEKILVSQFKIESTIAVNATETKGALKWIDEHKQEHKETKVAK